MCLFDFLVQRAIKPRTRAPRKRQRKNRHLKECHCVGRTAEAVTADKAANCSLLDARVLAGDCGGSRCGKRYSMSAHHRANANKGRDGRDNTSDEGSPSNPKWRREHYITLLPKTLRFNKLPSRVLAECCTPQADRGGGPAGLCRAQALACCSTQLGPLSLQSARHLTSDPRS